MNTRKSKRSAGARFIKGDNRVSEKAYTEKVRLVRPGSLKFTLLNARQVLPTGQEVESREGLRTFLRGVSQSTTNKKEKQNIGKI